MMRYFFIICALLSIELTAFEPLPNEKKYIQTQEDKDNFQFYKSLYEANIAAPGNLRSIPKILHFIWLGPQEFPEHSKINLRKWVKRHPGWTVNLWTDREINVALPQVHIKKVEDFHFKFLEDCYELSDNYGEKSEVLRYEVLYQEGGIYIDHDLYMMKSLESLESKYDFFCGLEQIGPSILSSSVFPSTHLIASKPNHPILLETMVWLANNWSERENAFPGSDPISTLNRVKHRSFYAFQQGVKKIAGTSESRDIVFPSTYFSLPDVKKALYAFHLHSSSWYLPNKEAEQKYSKCLEKIEKQSNYTTAILLLVAGLNMGGLLYLFVHFKKLKKPSSILSLLLLILLAGCEKKEKTTEFQNLMGKSSEHWKYIKKDEDWSALNNYEKLYEKNKKFLSSPTQKWDNKKVVHFIWLGPKAFPPQSVENVRTWIAQNPDWEFKFWTDRNRPAPCSSMQVCYVKDFTFDFLKECYESSENYGEKSDILRYEILFREGGVYVDHDANCLKPFDNLQSSYDFYCGLEAPHPEFVGLNITSGNGVLGARPGHPVIKKVIDLIGSRWGEIGHKFRGNDSSSKRELVMQRTYIALTLALKDAVDKDNNVDIVLPSAYFFAKTGIPSLYSKHFYATAWADDTQNIKSPFEKDLGKSLVRVERRISKIQIITLLILMFNSIMLGSIFLIKKNK